jgi:hypothetical protein
MRISGLGFNEKRPTLNPPCDEFSRDGSSAVLERCNAARGDQQLAAVELRASILYK